MPMARKQIIILGGGYGGLAAMRKLSEFLDPAEYAVLLVDESDAHTIKTRFHEISVSRSRNLFIRFPLSGLARASRADFLQARVVAVNPERSILVTETAELSYHRLILAPGGQTNYFGVPGAQARAVGLQTYDAALRGSRSVRELGLDRTDAPARRVVICGAGIEGLEVAAMLRQHSPPSRLQITVVEKGDQLMARSQCREPQRRYMARYLERRSIELRLGEAIQEVTDGGVRLGAGEVLPADLVYWCSGVRRVDLDGLSGSGPFSVDEHLRSSAHTEIFAVGDFATVDSTREWANLLSAQRAIYQGELAAENIALAEHGRPMKLAAFEPKGEVIGLGDFDGVGILLGIPLQGLAAAAMKKAIESRYLTELYAQVPGFLVKTALGEEVANGTG